MAIFNRTFLHVKDSLTDSLYIYKVFLCCYALEYIFELRYNRNKTSTLSSGFYPVLDTGNENTKYTSNSESTLGVLYEPRSKA